MYSWGQVEININGVLPITGVLSIDYEEDVDLKNNYGAGLFPIGQGVGNFKYSGNIELYKEEIVLLQQAAAPYGGKIQLLPSGIITITYGDADNALQIDTLTGVKFMKNAVNTKSGDAQMTTKIPLLIGNILWNGAQL